VPRKRRKRRRHPCEAGWRVNWTAEFRKAAQALGIWEDTKRELRDLERQLRGPRLRDSALQKLRKQPVVAYYPYGGRRYPIRRLYIGKRTARAGFVLREDICRVWFVALVPRTDSTYKKRRWS